MSIEPRFTTPVQSGHELFKARNTVDSWNYYVRRNRNEYISARAIAATTKRQYVKKPFLFAAIAAVVSATGFGIWSSGSFTGDLPGILLFAGFGGGVFSIGALIGVAEQVAGFTEAPALVSSTRQRYLDSKATLAEEEATLTWMVEWDRLVRSTTPAEMAARGVRFDDIMTVEAH